MDGRRNYEKFRKYLKLNENEHTTYKNLWDEAKAVFSDKFITLNAYVRQEERFQINNVENLEKEE